MMIAIAMLLVVFKPLPLQPAIYNEIHTYSIAYTYQSFFPCILTCNGDLINYPQVILPARIYANQNFVMKYLSIHCIL